MFKEFKEFILTGNVVQFAVAVILAGAIGQVVNGFVTDIMMPIIGQFTAGTDFSNAKIVLTETIFDDNGNIIKPENAIMYGKWINTIINLIIVGFVLFWMMRTKSKLDPPAPVEAVVTQEELLTQIRDLLKK